MPNLSLSAHRGLSARALRSLPALALVVVVTCPSAVAAEEMDPILIDEIHTAATEAINAGQYDEALASLNDAILLGGSALLHFDRGRALFGLGRCKEADEAFRRTEENPEGFGMSPEILAQIESYRARYPQECLGTLLVTCEEKPQSLEISGSGATTCDEPMALVPGSYTITVTNGAGEQSRTDITIAGMSAKEVHVPRGGFVSDKAEGADEGLSALHWWGIGTGTLGVALLATALIVDVAVLSPRVDDFNADPSNAALRDDAASLQSLNQVLVISGGALTAIGAALLVIPLFTDAPAERVHIGPTLDYPGLSIHTRF